MSLKKTTENNQTVIILGSARSDGNTRAVVDFLLKQTHCDLIDLNDFNIGYFDYNQKNKNDDFLPLMKKITSRYQRIIFATPVYWYSMSAIMKTFFDRISDLLIWEKETGRQLRGKKMAVVSCSGTEEPVEGFEMPFHQTANYLGLHWLGHIHTRAENETIAPEALEQLSVFLKKIMKQ